MYTNIDTQHALEVISSWLDRLRNESKLPTDFPLDAIKEAMVLVMTNNIFVFGDLYFLQLLGTAMGTSAACMWATIYYGIHENNSLLPTHNNNLLLLRRFIDDMIVVWVGSEQDWLKFKNNVNNFGILKWDFKDPSTSLNFLDLTINIKSNKISTKPYQKGMNLYQYIHP